MQRICTCADAYILALPLGRYPLRVPPDRRHMHQHSTFKRINTQKRRRAKTKNGLAPTARKSININITAWEKTQVGAELRPPDVQMDLRFPQPNAQVAASAALCIPTGLPQSCARTCLIRSGCHEARSKAWRWEKWPTAYGKTCEQQRASGKRLCPAAYRDSLCSHAAASQRYAALR